MYRNSFKWNFHQEEASIVSGIDDSEKSAWLIHFWFNKVIRLTMPFQFKKGALTPLEPVMVYLLLSKRFWYTNS
jgi:hypothetical protein